jgi:hypothetical protein
MGISDSNDFRLNRSEVQQAWRYLKEDWVSVQEEAEYLIAHALVSNARP